MDLTKDQLDALAEVVNIGVGRASASLSDLIGERIELSVPSIQITGLEEMGQYLCSDESGFHASIMQEFNGNVDGRALLVFPKTSALKLSQALGQLDAIPDELDLDMTGILSEVGNIVLASVLGSLSNILDTNLEYTVPQFSMNENLKEVIVPETSSEEVSTHLVVMADAKFSVATRDISGSLIILFGVGRVQEVAESLHKALVG